MRRFLPIIWLAACNPSINPEVLAERPEQGAGPTIIFDLDARPLPEIPFPNDLATRLDPSSPTGRYLNVSEVASTSMEYELRSRANTLDGFGTYSPINVRFDQPIDLCSIAQAHHADDLVTNDAIYVVDVESGEAVALDLNRGFFPYLLPGNGNSDTPSRPRPRYYANDSRASSSTLIFDDHPEDTNNNGVLDPGEDTDQDGILDGPERQALPACSVAWRYVENTLWEADSNTLQIRPIRPLLPGRTYAVILSDRLQDASGEPIRSPFAGVNHPRQTAALKKLVPHLDGLGVGVDSIAFAWTFTTSTASQDLFAIRAGMYGYGSLGWLSEQYPAEWQSLHRLIDADDPDLESDSPIHLMTGDRLASLLAQIGPETGLIEDDSGARSLLNSIRNLNYLISGTFIAPNFMVDRDGLAGRGCADHQGAPATGECAYPDDEDEIFDIDRTRGTAVVGEGRVTFWCAIPKDQYRPVDGQPFPVSLYGHGYTSTRFEMLGFAGFHARMGIATCSLDSFAHGLAVPAELQGVVDSIAGGYYGRGLVAALMDGRARDLNNDGTVDSGGDFWTADTFHTRDAVRQTVSDWMAFIRVLRSFDGQRQWDLGLIGADGANLSGVAGDLDGDGRVDLGGHNTQYFGWGQSLGGIVSGVAAGVESSLTAAAPIAGAAGLLDVGVRSVQGGVKEGVHLRFMGLMVTASPHGSKTRLSFVASNINDDATVPIGEIDALRAGDKIQVENHRNGEVRAITARPSGEHAVVRLHIPANAMRGVEKARLADLYPGSDGLIVPREIDPSWIEKEGLGDPLTITITRVDGTVETVDTFGALTDNEGNASREIPLFQGLYLVPGTPLHAVAFGVGKYRSTPDYRRFVAIAATVLEAGDPVSFARYYSESPFNVDAYDPDAIPGTATLVVPTVGDMNVPVNTGVAMATAAHIISLTEAENPSAYAHYGRSQGQALADAFALEGVTRMRRWTVGEPGNRPVWTAETNPNGIQFDPDDMDQSTDAWNEPGFAELGALCAAGSDHLSCRYPWACGGETPCQPLKAQKALDDGRISALRMPVVSPTGDHGFLYPDPDARLSGGYDIDGHMVNLVGWFFRSGGRELPQELCMNVHPATVIPTCVDEVCTPGPAAGDAAACVSDEDCATLYALGVPHPEDPAYAERDLADPSDADRHVCAWIEELGE